MEQRNNSEIDRRFIYFQHSGSILKDLYLFTSIELSLYENINDHPRTVFDLNNLYKSAEYYNKALEIDENYSMAYTGLGRTYWILAQVEEESKKTSLWKDSRKYLQKAIQFDPYNGWAYSEMGTIMKDWVWDSAAARENYSIALRLMPNNELAHQHYFYHEFFLGNCEKASQLLRGMKKVIPEVEQPFNNFNLHLLYCQHKFKEITDIADQYEIGQMFIWKFFVIFEAYIHTGKFDRASKLLDSYKKYVKSRSMILMYEGILKAKMGNKESFLKIIENLNELSSSEYIGQTIYAYLYAAMGAKKEMYEHLEKALVKRDYILHIFPHFSMFNPYSEEEHFKNIISRSWIPLEENEK